MCQLYCDKRNKTKSLWKNKIKKRQWNVTFVAEAALGCASGFLGVSHSLSLKAYSRGRPGIPHPGVSIIAPAMLVHVFIWQKPRTLTMCQTLDILRWINIAPAFKKPSGIIRASEELYMVDWGFYLFKTFLGSQSVGTRRWQWVEHSNLSVLWSWYLRAILEGVHNWVCSREAQTSCLILEHQHGRPRTWQYLKHEARSNCLISS